MIHIYYGQDKNNINFEKSNILINKTFTQIDFDDNHDLIIDTISQSSLFDDKDFFVINDASFLSNKKQEDINFINNLMKLNKEIYCFNYDEKIDLNLKGIVYHKINKFNNLSKQKLVSQLLNKLQINFDNIQTKQYFESLLDNDPFIINNELNKLALYSSNITKTQVENSISPFYNPNIFKLLTFLLTNDKTKLIKLYENLILSKFLPMDLIIIINTQLLNLKIYKTAKDNK
jgi:DNA polymerase-3 subunit delta